ncbi:MAG: hypothetical protein HC848_11180 [Limnobacter sp.]|nr:hypothetical protein [Limnobacter sp.]
MLARQEADLKSKQERLEQERLREKQLQEEAVARAEEEKKAHEAVEKLKSTGTEEADDQARAKREQEAAARCRR